MCKDALLKAAGVARAAAADSRVERAFALLTVSVPLVGVCIAVAMLWHQAIGPVELALLVSMYFLTALGLSLGFHRHFSHQSFKAVPAVRTVLGVLGSMAAEGPVIFWVATHRRHHRFSDQPGDPHSPNLHADDIVGMLRGLWHAHVGWLFDHQVTDPGRWAPDLLRDRLTFRISRQYLLWVVVGLAIPAAIGGVARGNLYGAWLGLIWGGLVRMFVAHHTTWATNSLTHMFGTRPYATRDNSRNNLLIALLTLGDGWHNNHHAFPASAAHGLRWWQIDINRWILALLESLGLAWEIRKVPAGMQAARQRADLIKTAELPLTADAY